jgi:Domain of unknown function (DUF3597)
MTVMGSIFSKVFDEDGVGSGVSPCHGEGMRKAALGPLTFPQPMDVESALVRIAARKRETLHWQKSIVDLLKLLNLDSSVAARRQLAYELGYAGSVEDSAAMNQWLHREVMRKLAQSDQKVLNAMRD